MSIFGDDDDDEKKKDGDPDDPPDDPDNSALIAITTSDYDEVLATLHANSTLEFDANGCCYHPAVYGKQTVYIRVNGTAEATTQRKSGDRNLADCFSRNEWRSGGWMSALTIDVGHSSTQREATVEIKTMFFGTHYANITLKQHGSEPGGGGGGWKPPIDPDKDFIFAFGADIRTLAEDGASAADSVKALIFSEDSAKTFFLNTNADYNIEQFIPSDGQNPSPQLKINFTDSTSFVEGTIRRKLVVPIQQDFSFARFNKIRFVTNAGARDSVYLFQASQKQMQMLAGGIAGLSDDLAYLLPLVKSFENRLQTDSPLPIPDGDVLIYSLQGRLLYRGPENDFRPPRTAPCIVRNTNGLSRIKLIHH
jgi:hypothetical protein